MDVLQAIQEGKKPICIVGLGYVGLPLAIEFSRHVPVMGYDVDAGKIRRLQSGESDIEEVDRSDLLRATLTYTFSEEDLSSAGVYILTVPTPIREDKTPDLDCLMAACKAVGRHLSKGDVVVIESTVYPGAVEELCIPVLEKSSGLRCPLDFGVGYSPERISPGEKEHTLTNMMKIISGIDRQTEEIVAKVYRLILRQENLFRAESIRIAEAAKMIENIQRDVNISLMNEMSSIFRKMNIDIYKVLEAASTKWNFYFVRPGLVGGHCISVDPYYFLYKAQQIGCLPQLISKSREINERFSQDIVEGIQQFLDRHRLPMAPLKVMILGFSYKADIRDIRNTKVADLASMLQQHCAEVKIVDDLADRALVKQEYHMDICSYDEAEDVDMIIMAVPHTLYRTISLERLKEKYRSNRYVLVDIGHVFPKEQAIELGYLYWSV